MKFFARDSLGILVASTLVACGSKVNIDSGQIKGATEDVKVSSENFKEGMAKAADGLKGLDVTGVKTLYADDKELRANLEALKKAIVSVDAPGNVGIGPTTHAVFEITGYSGRLRIDAWLDDEDSKFIQDRRLLRNESQLDITYNYADDGINGTYRYCGPAPLRWTGSYHKTIFVLDPFLSTLPRSAA